VRWITPALIVAMVGLSIAVEVTAYQGQSFPSVADLVIGLGGEASAGLQAQLRAMGDPSVVVGYWAPGIGRYVDDAGASRRLPPDPQTRVELAELSRVLGELDIEGVDELRVAFAQARESLRHR